MNPNGSHSRFVNPTTPAAEHVGEGTFSRTEVRKANQELIDYMHAILGDGRREAVELRRKLKRTYWIIVILSTLMFLVGLALISTPLWAPFVNNAPNLRFILTSVGIGITELVGLYLFNPIARIQKLMGDMSQLTIALDSFTLQVALRLLESDLDKRPTLGAAASHVEIAANGSLRLVESHFEKWLYKQLGV